MRKRKSNVVVRREPLANLRKTEIYDLYWQFAAARQEVFFRRLEGVSGPLTDDPILTRHKFTNAYRASDRVSQYLIRNVIYDTRYKKSAIETIFRVLLFKFFNSISTWEHLENELGLLEWRTFSFDRYDAALSKAMRNDKAIYSGAYIIPPVKISLSGIKHQGHLLLLEMMLRGGVVDHLQRTKNLQEMFELLKTYPSLGDFLAFQFCIDINYTTVVDHDEGSFVVAGPGALDGLAKTFANASDFDPEDLISLMAERQDDEFSVRRLKFRSLWGRPMQLIDCQNIFCEVSKYTRVSHPDISGTSGRARIKQIYRPKGRPLQPWYPPKWGINHLIPSYPAANVVDLFSVPYGS